MSPHRRLAVVHETLGQCATVLARDGRDGWLFTLGNGDGPAVSARARLDDEWLSLDGAIRNGAWKRRPPATAKRLWEALHWRGPLDGGVALALDPVRRLRLSADVPLDEGVDVAARVREACGGFMAVAQRMAGKATAARGGRKPAGAASGNGRLPPGRGLGGLCGEAGWPYVERAGGRIAVTLEVPEHFCQAVVEEAPGGGVRARAEFVRCAGLNGARRLALVELLFAIAGSVRMVTASAARRDGAESVGVEVRFSSAPCAAEVDRALSALEVASDLGAREAKVLASNEELSKAYLAARGRSS